MLSATKKFFFFYFLSLEIREICILIN